MPADPRQYSLPVRGLISASQNPQEAHVQEMRDIIDAWASGSKSSWFSVSGKDPEALELNEPYNVMSPFSRTMKIPRPAMFRADPVTPNPDLGAALQALYKIAPSAKGRVNTVTTGPTPSLMEEMLQEGIPLSSYDNLNVLGQYSRPDRDIFIAPKTELRQGGMPKTLVHEVGHSVGIPHNRDLENLEGLEIMMQDAQAMKEGSFLDNPNGRVNGVEKAPIGRMKGNR